MKIIISETQMKNLLNEGNRWMSFDDWESIWFKLRKIDKSFGVPDDGMFTFGGLFFHYSNKTGDLLLPPQKLSDWRDDLEDAAKILDNYVRRMKNTFEESGLGLKLEVGDNYSMRIFKSNIED